MEQLYAQAGSTPRVVCEVDDLPAAQAFVSAGIAVGVMHGLTLATLPSGVTVRPLAERPAGSRSIEALAPAGDPSPTVVALLDRLVAAARDRRAPRAATPV
jgi:DNA-binding transcriptional LysR family regulator